MAASRGNAGGAAAVRAAATRWRWWRRRGTGPPRRGRCGGGGGASAAGDEAVGRVEHDAVCIGRRQCDGEGFGETLGDGVCEGDQRRRVVAGERLGQEDRFGDRAWNQQEGRAHGCALVHGAGAFCDHGVGGADVQQGLGGGDDALDGYPVRQGFRHAGDAAELGRVGDGEKQQAQVRVCAAAELLRCADQSSEDAVAELAAEREPAGGVEQDGRVARQAELQACVGLARH